MNDFIKQAYDAGVRQALNDFGLSGGINKTAGDLSPVTVGLASSVLPMGPFIAPVVSSIAAPQDRALSRFGHTLAGGLGGGLGGAFLGSLGGYGVGDLIDMARGEDDGLFADHKYRNMLLPAGALLGGLVGQGVGAGYGQRFSQDRDFDYQRVRD
jgi:hypothetical protein